MDAEWYRMDRARSDPSADGLHPKKRDPPRAGEITRAIRRRQLRLVIGPDARLMILLQRLLSVQSIGLAARFVFPIEKGSG